MAKENKQKEKSTNKNSTKKTTTKKVANKKEAKVASTKTEAKAKKRKSYADEKPMEVTPEAKNIFWVTVVVVAVLVIFYFISVGLSDKVKSSSKDDTEVDVQYEEIIAGRSFDMGDDQYYVVYYDMSDTENEEISELNTTISNFKANNKDYKIYKCDLSSPFNKPYVTTNEPNRNPYSAEDLLINGTTLIKFVNGTVSEYISDYNEVKTYLDSQNTSATE